MRSPPWISLPQVAHTVHMSALGLPGYHLHAAYAGDWQLSPTEVRALLTWVISPTAQLGLRCRGGGNVLVMGRNGQGMSSVFLLNGRRWGNLCDELRVCLCDSTRGC